MYTEDEQTSDDVVPPIRDFYEKVRLGDQHIQATVNEENHPVSKPLQVKLPYFAR